MFKWLTRNDGARVAQAKRRMVSSRASVFVEFAMVMPIVALVCSALIEIVGLWDAQVMANHAAWTVGRIVMVRGSDGLVFSTNLDKKSKTGITGSSMPAAIKEALKDVDAIVKDANKFNNRANIATLFLMSTCGIGYYGHAPGTALSKGFDTICKAAVTAMTDGVKGWIGGMADSITLPSFMGDMGTGIAKFVNDIVKTIVNKIVDAVISPIVKALANLLQRAFDDIMKKIDLDNLFAGDSEAARRARQIYGAAVRIVRAQSTIGKEVVTVKDMDSTDGYFMFTENSAHTGFKHLAYPQVVDAGASSDGYFVKDCHGWPPNAQGHAMVHVEINWPYEAGWLFPVLSGRVKPSTKNPPVATGHSMVFPQPNIANDNLYSEGADKFDPGTYTNNATAAYADLEKEMKNYLKFVQFCMKYRIDDEKLTLVDESIVSYSWKRCKELKDLWGIGKGYGGGDYALCWRDITDRQDQDALWRKLKPYFKPTSYHVRDYFHWEGQHFKYMLSGSNGNAGLGAWYDAKWPSSGKKAYTYADDKTNLYDIPTNSHYYIAYNIKVRRNDVFSRLYDRYLDGFRDAFPNVFVSEDLLRGKIARFAGRHAINVSNIAKWQTDHSYSAWQTMDKKIHDLAKKSEAGYPKIRDFIRSEIREIDQIIKGQGEYKGDPEDPVITPDDEQTMQDPEKSGNLTKEKWKQLQDRLRDKLAEVDAAVLALRDAWSGYSAAAYTFTNDRRQCVPTYFIETCFKLVIKERDLGVFDAGRTFSLPDSVMAYNIYTQTEVMYAKVDDYHRKLEEAYQKEVEYGAMLGLNSAGKAKREGKSLDEVIDGADPIGGDTPGSLVDGSDDSTIINRDRQEFSGDRWIWK